MANEAPQWGIEPVPERLRVLGLGDTVLLWGNLAVSLLVIVAGALLVPALSLKQALLAIVIASVAGCVLLGLAAAIGTDARVPAMVLMRAPLGQRGSYLATGLNVVQCLGWSVYELIIIASASAALSDRVFGFRAQWLWTLLFGGVAVGLAFLGPGRLRAPLRPQVRGLLRCCLAGLLDLVGDRQVRPDRVLARPRQGRLPDLLAGRRPDARERDLVDAARGRLHALRPQPPHLVLGRLAGLPHPGGLALRARRRCSSSLGTSPTRRSCRRRSSRAASCRCSRSSRSRSTRATRRSRTCTRPPSRSRTSSRGVPQRVLIAARRGARDRRRARARLSELPAFLFLLGSFFVPLFGVLARRLAARAARTTTASDIFARPGRAPGDDRRLARRVRALPVARAGRARLVDRARRPHEPGADRLQRLAAELRSRLSASPRGRSRSRARARSPRPSEGPCMRRGRRQRLARPHRRRAAPPRRRPVLRRPRAALAGRMRALIVAKCAAADRPRVLPRLAALGIPGPWRDRAHHRLLVRLRRRAPRTDGRRGDRRPLDARRGVGWLGGVHLGARGAARARRLPARDARGARPRPAALARRPGARPRRADGPARARRRLRPRASCAPSRS